MEKAWAERRSTNGALLPQERLSQNNPNWLHSDFKTIAYLYAHPVLLKMVQLGELNE